MAWYVVERRSSLAIAFAEPPYTEYSKVRLAVSYKAVSSGKILESYRHLEHPDPNSYALLEYERGYGCRYLEGDAHDRLVGVGHRIVLGSARIVYRAHFPLTGRALLYAEPHHDAVAVLAEFAIELAARVERPFDVAFARLGPCLGVHRSQHLVVVRRRAMRRARYAAYYLVEPLTVTRW